MIDRIFGWLQVALSWLLTGALGLLPGILLSLLVVAAALFFDDRAQRAVERAVERNGGRRALSLMLGRVARWSVLIFAAIVVLAIWNLSEIVATFIAGLGIFGLLIAFALQDITKNFAAGALLALQNPFSIGDRIRVRDFEGIVIDITMRTTALRTADGVEVLVPNADVYASPIVNFTHFPSRRHHVALTLPASIAAEGARERLVAALQAVPGPQTDPPPSVVLTGATNDAITLDAGYWLPSSSPEADEIATRVLARLHATIDELKREAQATHAH